MSDRALPLYEDYIPPEGYGGGGDEPPIAIQPMPKSALALDAPVAPPLDPNLAPPPLPATGRALPTPVAAPAPVQAPQPTAAPVGQPAPQPAAAPPPATPGRGPATLTPPSSDTVVQGFNLNPGTAALMNEQVVGAPPGWTVRRAMDLIIPSESSGNPTAANPKSSARGLAQYITGTWQQFAPRYGVDLNQYPTADRAPPNVQLDVFAKTLIDRNGGGINHWTVGNPTVARAIIGNALSPQAVGKTIQSGNPDETLTLIRQTLPGSKFSDTDRFAALEAWAVGRLLADGKPDEAEKMQDAITRVSHAGVNSHMMEAMAALKRGDLQGAAKHLDISYAFAPDGASGRFFVDSTGKKLYAQTVDEKTGTPLDKAFEVTPEAIEGQLKFTKNPVTYLKTLGDRQKQVAEARRADEQAKYYRDRNQTTLQVAQGAAAAAGQRQMSANDAALHRAFLNNETKLLTSGINIKDPLTLDQMRTGVSKELDNQTQTLPETLAPGTPEHMTWRSRTSDLALNIVANSRGAITSESATTLASQVVIGKYQLKQLQNSPDFGVYDPSNPNLPPLGVVSAETAAKLPPSVVKK